MAQKRIWGSMFIPTWWMQDEATFCSNWMCAHVITIFIKCYFHFIPPRHTKKLLSVFSIGYPKQYARSLPPVSGRFFLCSSCGSLHLAIHDSFSNDLFESFWNPLKYFKQKQVEKAVLESKIEATMWMSLYQKLVVKSGLPFCFGHLSRQ